MPSILHLDDDALDQKLIRAALMREGLARNLVQVDSKDAFIDTMNSRCFDLILSDYNMVGFDGMAALKVAQAACPDIPFIVLSGAMGETAAVELLKAGATDVVLKDRLERLMPAIRRAVREAADRAARRAAEDRLRASEARLRMTVESVRDYAIFSIDPAGRITGWNVGAERVFGFTESEVVGQQVELLYTIDDRAAGVPMRELSNAVANGFSRDDRFHQRKDGTRFFANGVVTPVYDDAHRLIGFTKVAQDVTELKERDAELRRARDAAEAASQAKDHFLAVLSHELRTPLTPVLTMAQFMERDMSLPLQARDAFGMIRRNIELEARLIDDLLDITRISRGKMEFNFSTVDAHEKVKQVIEMCSDDARAKGIELSADLLAPRTHVHADAARIQQVAWNLIKNAIKFTPAGGTIRVWTTCDGDGHFVLEVQDSGIGIEPDLLPRLFLPFEQGGKDVTRLFGGLGLGLTISKSIIEQHSGRIRAQSDGNGRGATFRIELPTVDGGPALEHAGPSSASAGNKSAPGVRVLLVEDNVDTAGVMSMVLTMAGFEVRVANSVAAALKSAAAEPPDVLVSDIGLPDGSGLDLMRQLQNARPILGIALSGYGQEEDVRRSRDAGFIEHLIKPIDLDALERSVRRVAALAEQGK
jgi:PAS domain S-box-containing protein